MKLNEEEREAIAESGKQFGNQLAAHMAMRTNGPLESFSLNGTWLFEAERQAELHWAYVEGVLISHDVNDDEIKLAANHYKTAFVHGWKHGQEALK